MKIEHCLFIVASGEFAGTAYIAMRDALNRWAVAGALLAAAAWGAALVLIHARNCLDTAVMFYNKLGEARR